MRLLPWAAWSTAFQCGQWLNIAGWSDADFYASCDAACAIPSDWDYDEEQDNRRLEYYLMGARRVFELLQRGCALEVSMVQLNECRSSYKFSLFFVSPTTLEKVQRNSVALCRIRHDISNTRQCYLCVLR